MAIQTGLRVSELTHLSIADIELGPGAHVRCHGKGPKDRATPLVSATRATVASAAPKGPQLIHRRSAGFTLADGLTELVQVIGSVGGAQAQAQAEYPTIKAIMKTLTVGAP